MSGNTDLIRLSKLARELNVGIGTIIEEAEKKGIQIENNPNTKLSREIVEILEKEFARDKSYKEESIALSLSGKQKKETQVAEEKSVSSSHQETNVQPEILIKDTALSSTREKKSDAETSTNKNIESKTEVSNEESIKPKEQSESDIEIVKVKTEELHNPKIVGKVDLDSLNQKTKPAKKTSSEKKEEAKQKKEKKSTSKKESPGKKTQIDDPEEEVAKISKVESEIKITTDEIHEIEEPANSIIESESVEKESPKDTPNTDSVHVTQYEKLGGPTILGKIELPVKEDKKKPVASSTNFDKNAKKKRKRITKGAVDPTNFTPSESIGTPQSQTHKSTQLKDKKAGAHKKNQHHHVVKTELTQEEIDQQVKETLARLSSSGKSTASKYRRQKRDIINQQHQENLEALESEKKTLKVTEFVSASELASMMNVPVNNIISTCMSLGLFVSINQRLSAEIINIVAEEYGYKLEFVSAEATVNTADEEDKPEDLMPRAPIVTVMGHVDHGKTSLLDYIRKANVIAGEAGGITQHIGAYSVKLENNRKITFLDTPGHEAFTAMRARGAQVTDIVIIVVAADDNVMPQTKEAINHAQAAGVPIIIAINKIDKPNANPDKIREELAGINVLVEEWGGKVQCQEISAKKGINIDVLLEKVCLEADLLELKANPHRNASGTVIESSLDKGRGYVSTILVEKGTLKVGDIVLAGCFSGRVKALNNERGANIKQADPSTPALLLGLSGAPQAGDKFKVMNDEREAREIAAKRLQLQREQGYRTQKHITLDEIGRRLAIGDFKELNIIIKGDVDGSIEALTDSLLKLSTDKIQVKVIHKSVGQVTESDVLLASASNAIIVGFQVRPSINARKLAEQEQIDMRFYSIIYDAINELKSAMEGMLAPTFEEKVVCNLQVRGVYKISKVGTIAGCMVLDGKINRNTKVRVIRNGIVIHTGELGSLKRFKDDVKEVSTGYECGLNIDNFSDIQIDDIIEGYEMVEVKK
ncbi:MAG: translation initiation factor IF-2 [Bacteroidia bacterium]|nr:translation initiation factor IF-2 [Bacteroidia bacterium]MCZ2247676.1 translation initiation factor IF-2 [Bacteroidia bacterium]